MPWRRHLRAAGLKCRSLQPIDRMFSLWSKTMVQACRLRCAGNCSIPSFQVGPRAGGLAWVCRKFGGLPNSTAAPSNGQARRANLPASSFDCRSNQHTLYPHPSDQQRFTPKWLPVTSNHAANVHRDPGFALPTRFKHPSVSDTSELVLPSRITLTPGLPIGV